MGGCRLEIVQHEEDDDDDQEMDDAEAEEVKTSEVADFDQLDPSVILENKKADPAFGPVLRSKGFFWLATRSLQFGEWSQAGGILTVSCGGVWGAAIGSSITWRCE